MGGSSNLKLLSNEIDFSRSKFMKLQHVNLHLCTTNFDFLDNMSKILVLIGFSFQLHMKITSYLEKKYTLAQK